MFKKLSIIFLSILVMIGLTNPLSASGFTSTYGGSAVNPSDVAYAAYTFGSDGLVLYWPNFSNGQPNVAARFMNLTATTSSPDVFMPDATLTSVGYDAIIFNAGSNSFNVVNFNGGAIATIPPGQTYYLMLNNNTTQSGGWQTVQFGVGTGSANAAALAGPGLLAMAGLLQVNLNALNAATSFTLTNAALAQLYVWTGGSGTITLPTASSVGNGFFFELANNGSGSVTLAPAGGSIDGNMTSTFSQTQSGFIMSNGTNWFTVGKGIQNTFAVTLLNLNVAGSSNVTETSAQAQNIIQQFTGVLTGNIAVIVPTIVQLYDINNQTTGAYTITVRTSGGSGVIVPQGSTSILYGDGTNVVNGFTATVTSTIALADGSAAAPSLDFSNSPTTGIFSAASNTISVSANAHEVARFLSQASAVNYFGFQSSSTGNLINLYANGTDANIGINFISKGTGLLAFDTEGPVSATPVAQFLISDTPSAVNLLDVTGSATTLAPTIAAIGTDTNIGINVTPKGSGILSTTNFSASGTESIGGNATITGTLGVTGTITGTLNGNATNVNGTVGVANGGTGQTSLTANNVLVGNGSSAVQFVAPGSNGNILTSNGTTWTSTAPSPVSVVPTGSLIIWSANACPSGYLEANGAVVSQTTFAALYAIEGTTFGSNAGGNFTLPDTRGYFIRGWADNGSIDAGRTFGSTQTDAIKSHAVTITDPGHSHPLPPGIVASSGGGSTLAGGSGFNTIASPTTTSSAVTGITAAYSGATETRSINLALMFCIKT